MNKKNRVAIQDAGILFRGITYTRFKLPYEPFITLAVDKLTQSILGFSICETRTEKNHRNRQSETRSPGCVWNGIEYRVTGIPDHLIDNSPELSNASFVKALKELAAQSELASKNTEHGSIQIDRTPADLFVIPSCPLYKQPHPSPKNPAFGEAWRKRGHRFPRE
ncbi:hypothetical protein [Pseudomonas sp. BF-B-25]|uniref:hypothetical protein n=1 Tax=Pseudomonas sp. BF-B-25 TaxID=2832355 RepID=UPI001CBF08EE|nr:hypothetical protein [Pseudomonas sp. BF-B-25]